MVINPLGDDSPVGMWAIFHFSWSENLGVFRKPVLILLNGLSKLGEQARDTNLISAVGEIETHNLLIDSPASYHWAITALYYVLFDWCKINYMTDYSTTTIEIYFTHTPNLIYRMTPRSFSSA